MKANDKFTMRITPQDRKNFAELKQLFKRSSQSDAIRFVVSETIKAFRQLDKSSQGLKTSR